MVAPPTAVYDIDASGAPQSVIAQTAPQGVRAAPAVDFVVAAVATDDVCPVGAYELVVEVVAVDSGRLTEAPHVSLVMTGDVTSTSRSTANRTPSVESFAS